MERKQSTPTHLYSTEHAQQYTAEAPCICCHAVVLPQHNFGRNVPSRATVQCLHLPWLCAACQAKVCQPCRAVFQQYIGSKGVCWGCWSG